MINNELFAKIALQHVCEAIVLTDTQGLVLWVNDAFTKMTGYCLDDMLGMRPGYLLQGASSNPESIELISTSIKNHSACKVDIINYTKSGSQYLTEINLSPIFDSNGDIEYFVALQKDVTNERTHFQESIDLKAYRRALDEQAIVSVADPNGVITYVNENFCKISGYSSGELIGKNHRIINSRFHNRAFFTDMWRQISAGNTWHGEVCNRGKSGALYWVDTTIVPVNGVDGEILRYVSTRYDITERKAVEYELERAATYDQLTGLHNRFGFNQELKTSLKNNTFLTPPSEILLVKIDLDHFKELNDSLGHEYGDLLLKEMANRITEICDNKAVVARVGGDEFSLFLNNDNIDKSQIQKFLDKLHKTASKTFWLLDNSYTTSCSMGVARYPIDGDNLETLIINADMALNEAKKTGRNQWLYFDIEVRQKVDYQKYLKALLIEAIENDLFNIVLQPICSIKTGKHIGFEVLVRLSDKEQSIPPDIFIPVAEELGLINPIGSIVMQKAFSAMRKMLDLQLIPGKIAVNIAAPQFLEPEFFNRVSSLLIEYALAPSMVILEITETALIGRSSHLVAQVLSEFQAIGVEVALDDFGTGFSSLSHLRDFKVNKIKIDKTFVAELEHNSADRDLVSGLITFALKMGLDIVAEGVETQEQLTLLSDYGCQYFQGYFHSRPISVKQAILFLKQAR
ncbi:EAL domain-containing protein [Glaciecola sp. SC05]|uniref:putative bifunctional diguanylate cyclase/phosphodiesterase n=1 Tax=Glaciecola sp. SC05 TaxID=1987355 RepID=UPI003529D07C